MQTDPVSEFLDLYHQLDPSGQKYVEGMVYMLVNDPDDSVLDLLKRHKRGEQVAEVYLDLGTGEHVRVAAGQPIPPRHMPILEGIADCSR